MINWLTHENVVKCVLPTWYSFKELNSSFYLYFPFHKIDCQLFLREKLGNWIILLWIIIEHYTGNLSLILTVQYLILIPMFGELFTLWLKVSVTAFSLFIEADNVGYLLSLTFLQYDGHLAYSLPTGCVCLRPDFELITWWILVFNQQLEGQVSWYIDKVFKLLMFTAATVSKHLT